jgi:hypothetical protein
VKIESLDVLGAKDFETASLQARRGARRQDTQRRQARRSSRRAAEEVRVRYQFEGREADRANDSAERARESG